MANKRASVEQVEALHDALTTVWANRLKIASDNPTDLEKQLSAADLSALAKFLKDNNITAVLRASAPGKNLLANLPFEIAQESEH